MITDFQQLIERAKNGPVVRLIGVAAQDEYTIMSMYKAEQMGFITPILVGDTDEINAVLQRENIQFKKVSIIHASSFEEAAAKSVELIKAGEGDFLMKGLLDTSIFLKAIVNNATGLPIRGLLSHVMTFSCPEKYHKILITSDGGMVLYPDLEQKKMILENALQVARALEIEKPKVGIICAKEKVNTKMVCTMDAAALKALCEAGEFGPDVTVEGPISFDLAISAEYAKTKGYHSPVSGEMDISILPNIEAGNILGKTITALYKDSAAGVIVGCDIPIIMTSRGDDDFSKLASIALGCLMARKMSEGAKNV